ncbi:MAG: helix-turn-helix domain-containing protein [Propionibacteriaceae bacterium]|nr:helix-turn-helix domain-containing protein [Propionibacteriaceae bacterium]
MLRRLRGLSQEDFAEVVGVHRTYMGGVERGERNLTLRSIESLCARIGVDPIDMLTPDIQEGSCAPEDSFIAHVGQATGSNGANRHAI